MANQADMNQEVRERGALIVRRHLRKVVDPSRLVLMLEEKEEGESGYPGWHLYLDGNQGKGVCYVSGYGKGDNIVSFHVAGKRRYRPYDTFGEAERDDEFKAELVSRVKTLIGAGGGE